MVPAPESNNTRAVSTLMSRAQLLRFKEGTHVPDPKMVIFILPKPQPLSIRFKRLEVFTGDFQDAIDGCPGDVGDVFRAQIG